MTPIALAQEASVRGTAFADPFQTLSAEWWQWALSIPTSVNPQLDAGQNAVQNAVVGQRGPVWFLAGVFGGGRVTRTCRVPEGVALFFPLINSVNINTPGVCGEESKSVEELRNLSAEFIDGAINLSLRVDGVAVKGFRRVKSKVFFVALPEDNVFDRPCAPLPVPAGIYSPAVDDGFYVLIDRLPAGAHTLRFHAENPSARFAQDVVYNLTVVSVSTK